MKKDEKQVQINYSYYSRIKDAKEIISCIKEYLLPRSPTLQFSHNLGHIKDDREKQLELKRLENLKTTPLSLPHHLKRFLNEIEKFQEILESPSNDLQKLDKLLTLMETGKLNKSFLEGLGSYFCGINEIQFDENETKFDAMKCHIENIKELAELNEKVMKIIEFFISFVQNKLNNPLTEEEKKSIVSLQEILLEEVESTNEDGYKLFKISYWIEKECKKEKTIIDELSQFFCKNFNIELGNHDAITKFKENINLILRDLLEKLGYEEEVNEDVEEEEEEDEDEEDEEEEQERNSEQKEKAQNPKEEKLIKDAESIIKELESKTNTIISENDLDQALKEANEFKKSFAAKVVGSPQDSQLRTVLEDLKEKIKSAEESLTNLIDKNLHEIENALEKIEKEKNELQADIKAKSKAEEIRKAEAWRQAKEREENEKAKLEKVKGYSKEMKEFSEKLKETLSKERQHEEERTKKNQDKSSVNIKNESKNIAENKEKEDARKKEESNQVEQKLLNITRDIKQQAGTYKYLNEQFKELDAHFKKQKNDTESITKEFENKTEVLAEVIENIKKQKEKEEEKHQAEQKNKVLKEKLIENTKHIIQELNEKYIAALRIKDTGSMGELKEAIKKAKNFEKLFNKTMGDSIIPQLTKEIQNLQQKIQEAREGLTKLRILKLRKAGEEVLIQIELNKESKKSEEIYFDELANKSISHLENENKKFMDSLRISEETTKEFSDELNQPDDKEENDSDKDREKSSSSTIGELELGGDGEIGDNWGPSGEDVIFKDNETENSNCMQDLNQAKSENQQEEDQRQAEQESKAWEEAEKIEASTELLPDSTKKENGLGNWENKPKLSSEELKNLFPSNEENREKAADLDELKKLFEDLNKKEEAEKQLPQPEENHGKKALNEEEHLVKKEQESDQRSDEDQQEKRRKARKAKRKRMARVAAEILADMEAFSVQMELNKESKESEEIDFDNLANESKSTLDSLRIPEGTETFRYELEQEEDKNREKSSNSAIGELELGEDEHYSDIFSNNEKENLTGEIESNWGPSSKKNSSAIFEDEEEWMQDGRQKQEKAGDQEEKEKHPKSQPESKAKTPEKSPIDFEEIEKKLEKTRKEMEEQVKQMKELEQKIMQSQRELLEEKRLVDQEANAEEQKQKAEQEAKKAEKANSENKTTEDKGHQISSSEVSVSPRGANQRVEEKALEQKLKAQVKTLIADIKTAIPQGEDLKQDVEYDLSKAKEWLNKIDDEKNEFTTPQCLSRAARWAVRAGDWLKRKTSGNEDEGRQVFDRIAYLDDELHNKPDSVKRDTNKILEDLTRTLDKNPNFYSSTPEGIKKANRRSKGYQLASGASAVGSVGVSAGVTTALFTGAVGTTAVAVTAVPFLGTFATGALFSLAMWWKIRSEKDSNKRARLQAAALSRSKLGLICGLALLGLGIGLVVGTGGAAAPVIGAIFALFAAGLIAASYGLGAASAYDAEKKREKEAEKAEEARTDKVNNELRLQQPSSPENKGELCDSISADSSSRSLSSLSTSSASDSTEVQRSSSLGCFSSCFSMFRKKPEGGDLNDGLDSKDTQTNMAQAASNQSGFTKR